MSFDTEEYTRFPGDLQAGKDNLNDLQSVGKDSHDITCLCHKIGDKSKLTLPFDWPLHEKKVRLREAYKCPRACFKQLKMGILWYPCDRASCEHCGPLRARLWADRVRRIELGPDEKLLFVSFTPRTGPDGMTIEETFDSIHLVSRKAIACLRRESVGLRGASYWPGVACEYGLVLDVKETGHYHVGGLIRVAPVSGYCMEKGLPADWRIQRALEVSMTRCLSKSGFDGGGSVYLEDVHSREGSAQYLALANGRHWQDGKEWAFSDRRRITNSRGFFD